VADRQECDAERQHGEHEQGDGGVFHGGHSELLEGVRG
jgi:hypothetical protein